jgi:diaminopimelate epimerase
MKISFSKYHGTGNDFILLDNRKKKYSKLKEKQIEFLCNRRFGIGADGLILLEEASDADFKMVYYNSDGRISSMCGNGGRCLVAFANTLGIIKNKTKFIAADGLHEAIIESTEPIVVKLKMSNVATIETIGKDVFLNTGSPHYVRFVPNVASIDVNDEGSHIRNSAKFRKEGTNVNFVQPLGDKIIVRSYERGVEEETLSCGTGVVASVLASVSKGIIEKEKGFTVVNAMGGLLRVHYEKSGDGFKNVWLEGEATFIFSGEIGI